MIVLLDAGPLGLVTHPRATPENQLCKQWLTALLARNVRVLVPEIADYEVRRELLRAGRTKGIARLDQLKSLTGYVPLTTEAMLQAAEFWAQARRQGQPTAADASLDADVILAAQAETLDAPNEAVIVATTNVGHLGRYTRAQRWQEIKLEP